MPNWILGSYLIRDFSKHIVSIQAHSGNQEINIKKLDKNHWIAQPCKQQITLIYAQGLSLKPRGCKNTLLPLKNAR
jgi:predicted metalloprotease with PDZ domain